MAVVRNKTPDTLTLFRADAPPVDPGGEVTVSDKNFVDRAWPTSTWEVVTPPKLDGYVDASDEDAHLWVAAVPDDEAFDPSDHGVPEVVAHLEQAEDGERARVIAAESAGKARKTILEWSDNS